MDLSKITEAQNTLREMIDKILAMPPDHINYIVISIGTSPPEDPTVQCHNLVGGEPHLLFEAVNLIVRQCVETDPRFLVSVLKSMKGTMEEMALANSEPQGHA